ncbi:MAG TPA: Clp protease N-terminal domain-containing protein, partial [Anaerolineae bacterium]
EPEHLLMALLSPAAGSAWNFLVGLLGDPSPVRQRAEAALASLPADLEALQPPLSFRTERVLRSASEVAQRAGTQVDSQHLLLGLLDEGGAAADALRRSGVDARVLRTWLRQKRSDTVQPAPAPMPVRAAPKKEPVIVTGPLRKVLLRLIDWRAVFILIGVMGVSAWLTTQPDYRTAGVLFFVLGGWVFSVCAHEFGHALAADLGGDQTVREKGYLSFNPLVYTHPVLSILMPLLFLLIGGIGLPGGAVYIERHRLRSPRWDSVVSAAGPLASLFVTLLIASPFLLDLVRARTLLANLDLWGAVSLLVMLNVWGILFNLLPIPPLDGFGVIAPWLPPSWRDRLYAFSFIGPWLVIFGLMSIPAVRDSVWDTVFNIIRSLGVDPQVAGYGLSRFWFWR